MLKKYSIVNFVLLVIIAILGVLLSVCPFNVPASTDRYNGFVSAIDKGIDISGGVSAIYQAESASGDLEDKIDGSLDKIKDVFKNNADYIELYTSNDASAYKEIFVTRQGDKVRIEASNTQDTDEFFDQLAEGQRVSVTLEQASDTVTNPQVYLDYQDIYSAYVGYDYDNSAYTIVLELTESGKANLDELKNAAEETARTSAYLYLGEINSDNLLSTVTIENIDETIVFTSSNSNYSSTNLSNNLNLAFNIVGGSLDYNLSLLEKSYISPALGQNTMLFIGIACIITIVLALVFMCVRYGHLGLLGSLSCVFYLVLFVFFMQAIPFITLNLAGVFGSIIAFLLAVVANVMIFERVREEYALGKKIHLSFKGGIKKALWPILDSHIVIILACVFIWIFAPSILKAFAITIILGAIISVFSSLVITRYLMNIYLPLNSTKAKRLHLYRDKDVKELKEEQVEAKSKQAQDALPQDMQTSESAQVTQSTIGGNSNE